MSIPKKEKLGLDKTYLIMIAIPSLKGGEEIIRKVCDLHLPLANVTFTPLSRLLATVTDNVPCLTQVLKAISQHQHYGRYGGTRTHDPLIKSQVLLPTELRTHSIYGLRCKISI
jgi:hypothetical protein